MDGQNLTRASFRITAAMQRLFLIMDRQITALKAQKRDPNRINIYLDGEFAFGVSRIVAAWLQVGQFIDEQKIRTLQEQDAVEVGLQKSLRFLSYRPRSIKEVKQRLLKYGLSEEQIETVLERLIHSEMLNDDQFARLWVENRSEFRPRSHRLLSLELRQKGISEDEIQAALNDTKDDSALAYQAAVRYARRLNGLEWQMFRERLSAYLERRGFDYGTISPVVRQVWEEVSSNQGSEPNSDMKDF